MSKFRNYFSVCFTVITLLSFSNCAKRGGITGGPMDTLAPVILKILPENYSTNFTSDKITIDFDEYVKISKLSQNLIVSPPLEQLPEITPIGLAKKQMTIKINDTLKPNTTYSLNFGDAIVDNNESNPLRQFKYVFSTGNYIDSLKVEGKIKTANNLKTDNFVNIMLYPAENFNDSTVYKAKPLYITNTLDSLTSFTIENIKEGEYQIIALKDKNNDYKFDPKLDKIAFIKQNITIPTTQNIELVLFKSAEHFKSSRPTQITQNKWYIPYTGEIEDIKINLRNNNQLIPSSFNKLQAKDTLQLWFEPTIADSLKVEIASKHSNQEFTIKPREKIKEIDTLSVTTSTGVLHFNANFKVTTSTPLQSINHDLIRVNSKDSTRVNYSIVENVMDSNFTIEFPKEEEESYHFELLPGALKDFFGKVNDSVAVTLTTKKHSDYGNLTLVINNIERFPIIIDLLDEQQNIQATKYSTKENEIEFTLLQPRKYYVRITYDDNQNKKFDTGYYFERREPEKTVFYKDLIDVRANWEIRQAIDLDN